MVPSPAPQPALGTRAHARRVARLLTVCATCAASAACTTGRTHYLTFAAPVPARAARPADLRTLDWLTLRTQPHVFLLDAVAAYWPSMRYPAWSSSARPDDSTEPVAVYENDLYVGGLDMLRDVHVNEVARVQRLTPLEESIRFGQRHRNGAIVVDWVRAPASRAPR